MVESARRSPTTSFIDICIIIGINGIGCGLFAVYGINISFSIKSNRAIPRQESRKYHSTFLCVHWTVFTILLKGLAVPTFFARRVSARDLGAGEERGDEEDTSWFP
jgi:hypothetical protein